jgi:streptogramin lyase
MRRSSTTTSSLSPTAGPLRLVLGLTLAAALTVVGLAPSDPATATASTGAVTAWTDDDGDGGADIDGPTSLVVGQDGNVWFTNHDSNTIGEVDPATGNVLVFDGAGISGPTDITVGAGDQLLYTNQNGSTLGRISTTDGARSVCTDPQGQIASPESIVRGPYPYTYFTNRGGQTIGRWNTGEPCSAASTVEVLSDPQGEVVTPTDLVVGPDGAIWFTNQENGRLGRLDPTAWGPDGITTFPIAGSSGLYGITVGPDGNIWMTDRDLGNAIRFDPDTSTADTFPLGLSSPEGITTGPDGRLWVAGYHSSNVARISTDGIVQRFSGTGIDRPTELIDGPGDEVWGTSFLGDVLFSVDPGPRFSDVSFVHPFYDEIDWMAGEGTTTGFNGGIYKPNASVTRASMSAFMYRLAGEPPASPSTGFSDVPTTSPFATEIAWLVAEQITSGFPDGTFRPGGVVTRAAMSAFMYRLAPHVA